MALRNHDEIMLASQVNAGIQFDRHRLNVPQPKLLGDHHQMDLHLYPRKKFADAVSRPSGKRKHREPMPILRLIGREATGIETIRVVPEIRMTLDEVR